MSDRMNPLSFDELMQRALGEYAATGASLGLRALYRHPGDKALPLFGRRIETPVGPAAGPHTQMSQNLVAAYLAGARFFELKTVQTLDGPDLPVEKPCISAADEGYNVEWSTELRVEQARDEYIRAWYAISLLARAWRLGAPDGFVFNMSVGYDYKGVTSPKIDGFIEALKDARETDAWRACEKWARENPLPNVDEAFLRGISPRVCASVTLSTLHGCPPAEIERIAAHLIREKKLHTFVKCNPTLLGYDDARNILNRHGFDFVAFDDTHFKGDLQWADAVPMLGRLQALADETGVRFGVKLSNTFPAQITDGRLPGQEMYMSGRALYPLTVEMAARLTEAFAGKLRVSFSGGADAENVCALLNAGIWPITLATTLLKPGGYDRLRLIAERAAAQAYLPFAGVDAEKLAAVRRDAAENPRYQAPLKAAEARKQGGKAPLLDCFAAPCTEGCPLHQDAPAYLALAAQGRYADALTIILDKNPLPMITGTICNHRCMARCTRQFYEEPVRIREVKRLCAERGMAALLPSLTPGATRAERVAVIGGGPAGMAAAFFLARAGAKATIFEQSDALGGMVRHAIPAFRIADGDVDADTALLTRLGVDIRLRTPAPDAAALRDAGYTHTLLCVGAWKPGTLALPGAEPLNTIAFLHAAKAGRIVRKGPGAGDAASAACAATDTTSAASKPDATTSAAPAATDAESKPNTTSAACATTDAASATSKPNATSAASPSTDAISATSVATDATQAARPTAPAKADSASAPTTAATAGTSNPTQAAACPAATTPATATTAPDAPLAIGARVAIIGGGNTAMDAARVARRLPGVTDVTLVYRRTRAEMPADAEELSAALADGVALCELAAPKRLSAGLLHCERMRLGAPDASGRRAPEPTGEHFDVPADTIIAAVGEQVEPAALTAYGCTLDARGRFATAPAGVSVLGDAKRGPATVAQAVADAQEAVAAVLGVSVDALTGGAHPDPTSPAEALAQRGALCVACAPEREGARCLHCGAVCESCVEVCPNRANLSVTVEGRRQIVHVDRLCNECGNCATFCPYAGAPYRDKLTWFEGESALLNSENEGFALLPDGMALLRLGGRVYRDELDAPTETDASIMAVARAVGRQGQWPCTHFPK